MCTEESFSSGVFVFQTCRVVLALLLCLPRYRYVPWLFLRSDQHDFLLRASLPSASVCVALRIWDPIKPPRPYLPTTPHSLCLTLPFPFSKGAYRRRDREELHDNHWNLLTAGFWRGKGKGKSLSVTTMTTTTATWPLGRSAGWNSAA